VGVVFIGVWEGGLSIGISSRLLRRSRAISSPASYAMALAEALLVTVRVTYRPFDAAVFLAR